MRTTLDLDDDISEALKRLAQSRRVSFRQIANDTLRRGLTAQERKIAPKRFLVSTFSSAFRPGVDPVRLNQLADDLEVERLHAGGVR